MAAENQTADQEIISNNLEEPLLDRRQSMYDPKSNSNERRISFNQQALMNLSIQNSAARNNRPTNNQLISIGIKGDLMELAEPAG